MYQKTIIHPTNIITAKIVLVNTFMILLVIDY